MKEEGKQKERRRRKEKEKKQRRRRRRRRRRLSNSYVAVQKNYTETKNFVFLCNSSRYDVRRRHVREKRRKKKRNGRKRRRLAQERERIRERERREKRGRYKKGWKTIIMTTAMLVDCFSPSSIEWTWEEENHLLNVCKHLPCERLFRSVSAEGKKNLSLRPLTGRSSFSLFCSATERG